MIQQQQQQHNEAVCSKSIVKTKPFCRRRRRKPQASTRTRRRRPIDTIMLALSSLILMVSLKDQRNFNTSQQQHRGTPLGVVALISRTTTTKFGEQRPVGRINTSSLSSSLSDATSSPLFSNRRSPPPTPIKFEDRIRTQPQQVTQRQSNRRQYHHNYRHHA